MPPLHKTSLFMQQLQIYAQSYYDRAGEVVAQRFSDQVDEFRVTDEAIIAQML